MEGSTAELRRVLSTPLASSDGRLSSSPSSVVILHANLEHLRSSGDERYLFLRTLLESLSSSAGQGGGFDEELLFHCAVGLRHVILLKWDNLHLSFRCRVCNFCFAAGCGLLVPTITDQQRLQQQTLPLLLPRTVAMALLGCASSFWKRGWINATANESTLLAKKIDDEQSYLESFISNLFPTMQLFNNGGGEMTQQQQELFAYVNSLLEFPFTSTTETTTASMAMLSRSQHTATMSTSFLALLLGEFAGGNTSSARYNQPLEFHRLCHHNFESGSDDDNGVNCITKSGLDATLHLSMTSLSCFVGHVLNQQQSVVMDELLLELGSSVIDLTCDTLSWEFGGYKKWEWDANNSSVAGSSTLLRPPQRWRDVLINPEFLGAMMNVYITVRRAVMMGNNTVEDCAGSCNYNLMVKQGRMAHLLRQLLLQLSSISGPIFDSDAERGAYARFLMDGCLDVLELILNEQRQQEQHPSEEGSVAADLQSAEIVDLVTILSRLTANFKMQILSQLHSFPRYLKALCTLGEWLLESSLTECQRVEGDVESMEGVDWRNDAFAQILHCSDTMASDFWLVSGSTLDSQEGQINASQALASILAPLYGRYCMCRVRMSCLEEHYVARVGEDLDEIREEISAFGLEEEMASAASLGRLNVLASMTTLSEYFQQCMPRLMSLFELAGSATDLEMTPDMAALLEESRMLIVCACHLLTDECDGETPAIPESVIHACQGADGNSCLSYIASLVELLKSGAESQATRVAMYPKDSCLSPLLAKTLLWFFRRWAPAYVFPISDEYREDAGGILSSYSKAETAQPVITFCTTLCLLYCCHWPQEKEVQDESSALLLALAKKGAFVRSLIVISPSFNMMSALHSVCASLRHTASQQEVLTAMSVVGADLSIDDVRGYQRLPYAERARFLTCLIVACSEMQDETANVIFAGCLKAVEVPFSTLVQALS